jgi:hypothetical protein
MKHILTAGLAVLIFTTVTPFKVNAEDSINNNANSITQSDEAQCIKYIDNDKSDGKISYELNDNGKSYRVTEYIENNYEKVTSYVELKQLDDSYKRISKNISILNQDNVSLCVYDYTTNKLDTYEYEIGNNATDNSINIEPENNIMLNSSTGWEYDGTSYGYKSFFIRTLSFITQVLISVACPGNAAVTAATSIILNTIAENVLNWSLPKIYFAQAYYEKQSLDVPWVMVTGSKWVTRYYSDEGRTQYMNTTTEVVDNS